MRRPEFDFQITLKELLRDLPVAFLSVLTAMGFLALVYSVLAPRLSENPLLIYQRIFHIFFYAHIFIGAQAPTSLIWKRKKNVLSAALSGFFSSLAFAILSNVFFPFIIGKTLGGTVSNFHLCLIHAPIWVLGFAFAGVLAGFYAAIWHDKISYVSHAAHMFASGFATLFYLIAYGMENWLYFALPIFILTLTSLLFFCSSSIPSILLGMPPDLHGRENSGPNS